VAVFRSTNRVGGERPFSIAGKRDRCGRRLTSARSPSCYAGTAIVSRTGTDGEWPRTFWRWYEGGGRAFGEGQARCSSSASATLRPRLGDETVGSLRGPCDLKRENPAVARSEPQKKQHKKINSDFPGKPRTSDPRDDETKYGRRVADVRRVHFWAG